MNNIANLAGGVQIKQSFRELYLPETSEKDEKEANEIIQRFKNAFAEGGG